MHVKSHLCSLKRAKSINYFKRTKSINTIQKLANPFLIDSTIIDVNFLKRKPKITSFCCFNVMVRVTNKIIFKQKIKKERKKEK